MALRYLKCISIKRTARRNSRNSHEDAKKSKVEVFEMVVPENVDLIVYELVELGFPAA